MNQLLVILGRVDLSSLHAPNHTGREGKQGLFVTLPEAAQGKTAPNKTSVRLFSSLFRKIDS